MPRRPRHLGHHAPPPAHASPSHAPRAPVRADPGGALRTLVEEAIVTAAALNARDDLEIAAASTQRLGALASGMWLALSRELTTAAERLDRSTHERMQDIHRRAESLHVEAADVIRAGLAAAHLAEHHQTLEALLQPQADAHRLLAANLLFGFAIDHDEDDDSEPDSEQVMVFLWPAPLAPATVTMLPSLLMHADAPENLSLDIGLHVPAPLLEALTRASGLPSDRASQALSALAVACWTAHHLDEHPPDDEDDEDEPSGPNS